jgi:hypothetical protein
MESLILGDLHANECVNEGLHTVLSNVDQEITQKWLQSMDVPLTVDVVMLKMKKLVAWSVVPHDGDVQAPTAMARGLERRAVEDEPVAVTIDPWARGTGERQTHAHASAFTCLTHMSPLFHPFVALQCRRARWSKTLS